MVTRQRDEIPQQRGEPPRTGSLFGPRRRRAAVAEAEFLDGVVNTHLRFIDQLPAPRRDALAEALAVLVMLAQDHRHHGQGWISRRELRRRIERALSDLDALLNSAGPAAALPHPVD